MAATRKGQRLVSTYVGEPPEAIKGKLLVNHIPLEKLEKSDKT
jgi:hypothetical protein